MPRYDFDQNEVVLCLQSVTLESSGAPGGYRDFIAVGTGFDFGEDRASRGNVSMVLSTLFAISLFRRHHGHRIRHLRMVPERV
jgi:hypothetical protein